MTIKIDLMSHKQPGIYDRGPEKNRTKCHHLRPIGPRVDSWHDKPHCRTPNYNGQKCSGRTHREKKAKSVKNEADTYYRPGTPPAAMKALTVRAFNEKSLNWSQPDITIGLPQWTQAVAPLAITGETLSATGYRPGIDPPTCFDAQYSGVNPFGYPAASWRREVPSGCDYRLPEGRNLKVCDVVAFAPVRLTSSLAA